MIHRLFRRRYRIEGRNQRRSWVTPTARVLVATRTVLGTDPHPIPIAILLRCHRGVRYQELEGYEDALEHIQAPLAVVVISHLAVKKVQRGNVERSSVILAEATLRAGVTQR